MQFVQGYVLLDSSLGSVAGGDGSTALRVLTKVMQGTSKSKPK